MAETPERRPDDTTADPNRAEIPPDLAPLHERLTADGERWRRRAPDGSALPAWARATLVATASDTQPQRQPDRASQLRDRRLDTLDEHPIATKGPRPTMALDTRDTKPRAPWRGIAGALAATIIVGAFAALLIHNAGQRSAGPTATSTVRPTPGPQETATPGQGPQQPYVQPAQVPVVAPSDLQILYRVTDSNVIQRSTDGGKHYTTTAQPRAGLDISFTGLAVSPLNAQVVFFNAGGTKNGAGCPEPSAYGALSMHGGLLASGFIPCSAQFISQDGGAHWSRLTLPTGGVLGGTTGFLATPFARNAQQSSIVAQGQRLYSAVAFANQGGTLVDSPGARLVASDNGGATWRLIDDPIVRLGGNAVICDFAAAPSGSTIYATTSPGSCASETYPPISLWRSDDGGRSWIGPIRKLPALAESGMVVSSQGWLYTFLPDVAVQGHGASMTYTVANAKVSKDGGKTFIAAPSAGLPANVGMQSGVGLAGPLATLSDGSVVFQIEVGDANGNFQSSLYRWLPGESAWTKLGGGIDGYATAVLVTPNPAGGDTLTAIDFSADTITFTTTY